MVEEAVDMTDSKQQEDAKCMRMHMQYPNSITNNEDDEDVSMRGRCTQSQKNYLIKIKVGVRHFAVFLGIFGYVCWSMSWGWV